MKTFRLCGHVTITWLVASLSILGQSQSPEGPEGPVIEATPPALGPSLPPSIEPSFSPSLPSMGPSLAPGLPTSLPPQETPGLPGSLPDPVLPAMPTSSPTASPVTLPGGAPAPGTPVSGPHFGPQLPGVGYPGVGPSGAPLELPTGLPGGPGPVLGPVAGPHCNGPQCPPGPVEEEIPIPIIKLKIKAPACAEVGKELEYRVKVENCTAVDAHNVVVKMNLPASVRVLRASPQPHQTNPELQWNFGTIPGFGCHDIVVLVTPIGLADVKACTRVTFEHGQCVTTKVIIAAPEGSADGKGGTVPGPGGMIPGPGGMIPGPGGNIPGVRSDFQVEINGPKEAPPGQPQKYTITIFNKSDRAIFDVGTLIEWAPDFEEARPNPDLFPDPTQKTRRLWPAKGLFEMIPAGTLKTVTIELQSRVEGRLWIRARASGKPTQDPKDGRIIEATDEFWTTFRRGGIPGMTLEMFDSDDPILKNGSTSYPIVITNQGKLPITNLRLAALVPEFFDVERVQGPPGVNFKMTPEGAKTRIDWDSLDTIAIGDKARYEVFVKAKGMVGMARFDVKFTADQLDRTPQNTERWIHEQESTMVVPDEETRAKMVSRQSRPRLAPAIMTSDHP